MNTWTSKHSRQFLRNQTQDRLQIGKTVFIPNCVPQLKVIVSPGHAHLLWCHKLQNTIGIISWTKYPLNIRSILDTAWGFRVRCSSTRPNLMISRGHSGCYEVINFKILSPISHEPNIRSTWDLAWMFTVSNRTEANDVIGSRSLTLFWNSHQKPQARRYCVLYFERATPSSPRGGVMGPQNFGFYGKV